MTKSACMVCCAVSSYYVDILNTNLQSIYEKLTDLKVNIESHYLCFMCNRRLQQCYQLQQLAMDRNHIGLCDNNSYGKEIIYKSQYALTPLSISKMLNVTIPCKTEMIMKVKEELDEKNTSILNIDMKQNNLDDLREQEIKIEPFNNLNLECKNINYSEMVANTQILQSYNHTTVETDKLDTNSILNRYECKDAVIQYSCDISAYTANSEITLNNHHIIHAKSLNNKLSKVYRCDICNKAFSVRSTLISHKRTHLGDKPFTCNVCNKTFSFSSHLISHKRTHTGDKPYSCDVCNKTFSISSNLITHKRSHTGDKPYSCDVCNKTFSRSSHLITHNRTHTGDKPYTCDVCNKTFSQSSHLITHIRTHTGDKPYTCNVCNKTFSQSSILVRHRRIHTGDKPYSCDVCNKTFCASSILVTHKKYMHNILEPT